MILESSGSGSRWEPRPRRVRRSPGAKAHSLGQDGDQKSRGEDEETWSTNQCRRVPLSLISNGAGSPSRPVRRAHLVPAFSFGENEVFDQVDNARGTWLRWTQERLQNLMGISLPLFHARGVFQYSFGLMPYRKPIHTVGKYPPPAPPRPAPGVT